MAIFNFNFQCQMADEVFQKLDELGEQMASVQENIALLQAAADQIKNNTNLIQGIQSVQAKIFDEVKNLIANSQSQEELLAAIDNLQVASNEQTAEIAKAVALNTSIDELNPDIAIVDGVVVENT